MCCLVLLRDMIAHSKLFIKFPTPQLFQTCSCYCCNAIICTHTLHCFIFQMTRAETFSGSGALWQFLPSDFCSWLIENVTRVWTWVVKWHSVMPCINWWPTPCCRSSALCAFATTRHSSSPLRHTWETFAQHCCCCGGSTIELDYCVWAVSTSPAERKREGRKGWGRPRAPGWEVGGSRRAGIFEQ